MRGVTMGSILGLVAASAMTLAAAEAGACSCMQIAAREAVDRADAVFEGRVVEVREDGMERVITLAVVQYWKGVDTERVELRTASSSAACGVEFVADTSWLVYAQRREGALRTGLCDRTQRIEDAETDLEVLQAGVVPVDIGPDDEVEPPAPRAEPARGGCASCAIGASSPSSLGLGGLGLSGLGLLGALAALRLARRRVSRGRRRVS